MSSRSSGSMADGRSGAAGARLERLCAAAGAVAAAETTLRADVKAGAAARGLRGVDVAGRVIAVLVIKSLLYGFMDK